MHVVSDKLMESVANFSKVTNIILIFSGCKIKNVMISEHQYYSFLDFPCILALHLYTDIHILMVGSTRKEHHIYYVNYLYTITHKLL